MGFGYCRFCGLYGDWEMRSAPRQVATLELAKAKFEASWKEWKAGAGFEQSAPKP